VKCPNFKANSQCRDTKLGRCVLKEFKSLGRGAKRYLVNVEIRQCVNTENENQIWNKNAQIQHLNPNSHDLPQGSAFKNSTFRPHSARMFCLDLRKQRLFPYTALTGWVILARLR